VGASAYPAGAAGADEDDVEAGGTQYDMLDPIESDDSHGASKDWVHRGCWGPGGNSSMMVGLLCAFA
jgi:hypothetical protein